jgi:hypothetical protein
MLKTASVHQKQPLARVATSFALFFAGSWLIIFHHFLFYADMNAWSFNYFAANLLVACFCAVTKRFAVLAERFYLPESCFSRCWRGHDRAGNIAT